MSWRDPDSFKNNGFDALRLLLAVGVIYSHSFPLSGGNAGSVDAIASLTSNQVDGGFLAVNAFFLISGFLIAHSYLRSRNIEEYLSKRANRILPGYLVAMLITATVFAPLAASKPAEAFGWSQLGAVAKQAAVLSKYPPASFLFAKNPFPHEVNGSLWTIQFEFLCYLGVVAIGLLGILRRPRLVLALLCLCLLANAIVVRRSHLLTLLANKPQMELLNWLVGYLPFWPRFACYYAVGVAFYIFRERIPFDFRWAFVALAVLVASVFLGLLKVVLPLAGAYLLFYLAFQRKFQLRHTADRGDISYGVYLYAFPVQQCIVQFMGHVSPWGLFVMSVPFACGAGWLSWTLVERPFLKRGRQHATAHKSTDVAAPTSLVQHGATVSMPDWSGISSKTSWPPERGMGET